MFRTRIAPSPSGNLHIGNARTAYFNYLAAKSSGGQFILRIDDTDKERSKTEYVQNIIDTLEWLTLTPDEIYFQSQRKPIHLEKIEILLSNGWAKRNEDGSIYLNISQSHPTEWYDIVSKKNIKITERDLETSQGSILVRSDGNPTYNFASVVDDGDLDISLIIRGVDHITNTSKQVLLWHALGYKCPQFAHISLIAEKGKPLSKSDGAASMTFYRDKGYDPDAMLNYLARLGWGPTVDDKTTKMLPKERMIELFLVGGSMKQNNANVDLPKLESFDRKYKAKKGIWRTDEKLI